MHDLSFFRRQIFARLNKCNLIFRCRFFSDCAQNRIILSLFQHHILFYDQICLLVQKSSQFFPFRLWLQHKLLNRKPVQLSQNPPHQASAHARQNHRVDPILRCYPGKAVRKPCFYVWSKLYLFDMLLCPRQRPRSDISSQYMIRFSCLHQINGHKAVIAADICYPPACYHIRYRLKTV